jgi:hypothetical protein
MSPFVWIAVAIVIVATIWWALTMSSSRRAGANGYIAPVTTGASSGAPGAYSGTLPPPTAGTSVPTRVTGPGVGIAAGGTSSTIDTMPGQKVGEPAVGEPVAPGVNPGAKGGPGPGGSAEGAH